MDVTFCEFVSFFSSSQPHLQGESKCEQENEFVLHLHVLKYALILMDVVVKGSINKLLFKRRKNQWQQPKTKP